MRQDGVSDDRMHGDISNHQPGDRRDPMASVTYVLVPGLSDDEMHAGLHVDATVELRPMLPAEASGSDGSVPGELDALPDQTGTGGAFGPFRCPAETDEVALGLSPIQVRSYAADGTALNANAGDRLASTRWLTGHAVIDLRSGTARWTPDAEDRL